jgi:hypothetical protein
MQNNSFKPIKNFRDFPFLYREINARDVVFRADFKDIDRANKPPFSSRDCPYSEKQLAIWNKLFVDTITEEQALEEITLLMEEYYNTKYPLKRGLK